MDLVFSRNFVKRLFDEGVVPSQGVRPLSGTIDAFASDPIADIYMMIHKTAWYGPKRLAKIVIDVKPMAKESTWEFKNGPLKGKSLNFLIPSETLNKFNLHPEPMRSLVALHESGHATVEMHINRIIPTTISSTSRDPKAGGFVKPAPSPKGFIPLRSHLVNQIAMALAGGVAEDLVFGERSMGASQDIRQATAIAAKMVTESRLGGDKNIANHKQIPRSDAKVAKQVELILKEGETLAREILSKEKIFHGMLTDLLRNSHSPQKEDIVVLVRQYWSKAEEARDIVEGKGPKHKIDSMVSAFIDACRNNTKK